MQKTIISLVVLVGLQWLTGCSANKLLAKRVDILEQDLSDLHQANRDIEKRLDEMQIRLQIINKRLAAGNQTSGEDLSADAGQDRVKIVKLSSGKAAAEFSDEAAGKRASRAIDPKQVSERLAVDRAAAGRSIQNQAAAGQAGDDQDADDNDDGFDEESITRDFTRALAPFRSSRYVRAIETLTKFARDYAGHPLAIEAIYFLGRAHLARGEYRKANIDFSAVSRQDPKNKLAPDAMLMAARCQEKLGRIRDARTIYLQLVQAFPLSEEAAKANQRLKSIR